MYAGKPRQNQRLDGKIAYSSRVQTPEIKKPWPFRRTGVRAPSVAKRNRVSGVVSSVIVTHLLSLFYYHIISYIALPIGFLGGIFSKLAFGPRPPSGPHLSHVSILTV